MLWNNKLLLCLISVVFLSPGIVSAGTEITPMTGYRIGGEFNSEESAGKVKFDETETYGLVIDLDYKKYQQITLLYSLQETSLNSSQAGIKNPLLDVDVEYFHIGGNQIWVRDKMRPFFGATIGGTHFSAKGRNSTTKFSLSIGGGTKFFLSKRIALMVGIRGYMTFFNDSSSLYCGNGGCLVGVSGSGLFQLEGNAGVTFRF